MDYGEVLHKAWKITWKNKVLWLFGLLASCGRSSGGGSGGGGSSGNYGNASNPLNQNNPFQNLTPWFDKMDQTFQNLVDTGTIWWIVAGVVVFVLLLVIISLVLGTLGRAGLARGAWLADTEEGVLSLGRLWKESLHYFWRVLLLLLLFGFGIALVILILIAPVILFGVATMGIGLLCLIPFICLIIPLGIAVGVLQELSIVAIAGEDQGVFGSIRRGWEVIRDHLGPVIVISIILLVGGGIARLLIALPAALILLPIVVGVVAGTESAMTGGFIAAGAFLLIYIPVSLFLSSVLNAYLGSAWALTYRRLAVAGASPVEPAETADLPAGPPSEV